MLPRECCMIEMGKKREREIDQDLSSILFIQIS